MEQAKKKKRKKEEKSLTTDVENAGRINQMRINQNEESMEHHIEPL